MKKRDLLFLVILAAIAYNLEFANSQSGVGVGLKLIDTSPPILNFTNLVNNSGFVGNLSVFLNVSDASNIRNCSIIINNNFNASNSTINKSILTNFNLDNMSVGRYNISINCTDDLGFSALTPAFTI